MSMATDEELIARNTTSGNLDALEEVLALHTSVQLRELPSGWHVGLAWQSETSLRCAREAGLDALHTFWAATFSALWDLPLSCACHRHLVVITVDRQVRFLDAILVIDGSDVLVAARVRRDEAVFDHSKEVSVLDLEVRLGVVEVIALVLVEVSAQTA